MTLAELENSKAQSLVEIAAAGDASAIEALRVKYVGRNGSIPALIKGMKDVPKEERPAFGKAVQAWRAEVEAALAAKSGGAGAEKGVEADLTLPGRWFALGAKHPLSRVLKKRPAYSAGSASPWPTVPSSKTGSTTSPPSTRRRTILQWTEATRSGSTAIRF